MLNIVAGEVNGFTLFESLPYSFFGFSVEIPKDDANGVAFFVWGIVVWGLHGQGGPSLGWSSSFF